jgi:hypothetical protein
VPGQSSIKAFALDGGGLDDFGDALSSGEMAQRDQQDAGFSFIFQSGFKVLRSKIRALVEPSCETLALRFMGFRKSATARMRLCRWWFPLGADYRQSLRCPRSQTPGLFLH